VVADVVDKGLSVIINTKKAHHQDAPFCMNDVPFLERI